jgi:hypothetical protein
LQRQQAVTVLPHDDRPPRETGNTWSTVASREVQSLPQYAQV